MKSKKGSVIAEAAIVYPVVIAVVLTVVYILINLYADASIAARDHLALRYESGAKTGTVIRPNEYRGIAPEDKFGRKPFSENVEIVEATGFQGARLEDGGGTVYVINERSYIRKVDFLKDI